jgi:FlaA1/EpsC-like NDP-sugar epimerase
MSLPDKKRFFLGLVAFFLLRKAFRKIFQARRSLAGQTVLITGGGSGLGRNMAKRIANLGVKKLILWDVNRAGREKFQRKCTM